MWFFALLVACGDPETQGTTLDPVPSCASCVDADGDGWTEADGDCEDASPHVFPGAPERCDGLDQDCDGAVDEGLADADGDGLCDGRDEEICDGADNDGDGEIDEGSADTDGDGIADCASVERCDGLDNDGDGERDEGFDGDSDGVSDCAGDCAPADPAISASADEVGGNGLDDDCDGLLDEVDWAPGDVQIEEIMANPAAVSDARGEWVELRNTTSARRALSGLFLEADGARAALSGPVWLEPGARAVVGLSLSQAENGWVPVDGFYEGISLTNGAFDLRLVLEDGEGVLTVDRVTGLSPSGATWQRDETGEWCEAPTPWSLTGDRGSPGAENPPCQITDQDGDGFGADDCDDLDDSVFPGAAEVAAGRDNDCDGEVELAPVARAEVLGSPTTCSTLSLDGGTSEDDGAGPLRWSWSLLDAPAGAVASLSGADAALATLSPDVAGLWRVGLTVFDEGDAASAPLSLEIAVSPRAENAAPVAVAGPNLRGEGVASCEEGEDRLICLPCAPQVFALDAGASADPDGDPLRYRWTVVSGLGTLDGARTATPTLTVATGTPVDASGTATLVLLSLEVTDCLGATATDTLPVYATCAPAE